jgi:hypothetical protein
MKQININEELKKVLEEVKPLKIKKEHEKKKIEELVMRGVLVDYQFDKDDEKLAQLEMKASFLKIIKSLFMEEVTKNKKMTDQLLKNRTLTSHPEIAEKNGVQVEVMVIDQSMDERIELIPVDIQEGILEKLAKSHKENLALLKNPVDIEKEKFELDILLGWLPKEVGKDEIMAKLQEFYPDGIEAKMMGPTIGRMKKEFERVDGKLLSECVKSWIK